MSAEMEVGDVYFHGCSVTSLSIDHTTIDIFFEDTCLQVIWVWNTVISFIFWVIYDDVEVL